MYLYGSTVHGRRATLVPQESSATFGPRDSAAVLAAERLARLSRRGFVRRKVGEFFLRGEIHAHLLEHATKGDF